MLCQFAFLLSLVPFPHYFLLVFGNKTKKTSRSYKFCKLWVISRIVFANFDDITNFLKGENKKSVLLNSTWTIKKSTIEFLSEQMRTKKGRRKNKQQTSTICTHKKKKWKTWIICLGFAMQKNAKKNAEKGIIIIQGTSPPPTGPTDMRFTQGEPPHQSSILL